MAMFSWECKYGLMTEGRIAGQPIFERLVNGKEK